LSPTEPAEAGDGRGEQRPDPNVNARGFLGPVGEEGPPSAGRGVRQGRLECIRGSPAPDPCRQRLGLLGWQEKEGDVDDTKEARRQVVGKVGEEDPFPEGGVGTQHEPCGSLRDAQTGKYRLLRCVDE